MKPYHLGLYEKAMPAGLTWTKKLEAARDAGFDWLELSIDETNEKLARLEMSDQELGEIAHAMAHTGIYIRTICLSGHRKYPFGSHDPAVRMRGWEIIDKAVLLAWRLGIRIIQLAGYDVYYEDSDAGTCADFEKGLRHAVDTAAAYGILLGFETMETHFMDTVSKAMRYVSQMDSPYLGVYPDMGNLTNAALVYGHSLQEDIAQGAGHIFAAHLKETRPGIYREVPFGTGHTDYAACIRTLYGMGVRMFTGEFWYAGGEGWRQELSEANSFLRGYLDQQIIV